MARRKASIKFQVDARSLRSFKKNVSIAGKGIKKSTKQAVVEVCEDILIDATKLVPIDTGALAESAGYVIDKDSSKGYTAKLGYGVNKNVLNKRTGKLASTYAGAVHENLGRMHNNGQAKFFEQAVKLHEKELETKSGKAIREYLSKSVVRDIDEPADFDPSKESERESIIASRNTESFTSQLGKYLPFPVPKGMIRLEGGRWVLNTEAYKKTKDVRRKSVQKYKGTSRTAEGIRSNVSNRYKGSPVKSEKSRNKTAKKPKKKASKSSSWKSGYDKKIDAYIQNSVAKVKGKQKKKRKAGDTTSSITKVSKASTKTTKTSKSIKGSRSKAGSRSVKQHKFISELAHETAIDEFIAYMQEDTEERKREKKKRKKAAQTIWGPNYNELIG